MAILDHCLHTDTPETVRWCCWCPAEQKRVADPEPIHGPRFEGQRFTYHWSPPRIGGCPRNATEQTYAATERPPAAIPEPIVLPPAYPAVVAPNGWVSKN